MTRFLGPNANVLLLSTDKKTESNADKMKSLITRFIGQNGKGRVESKCINDLVGCGFKDGSFDMVFVFLKEILVNDKELLVETFRILKLLGILIIYEPLHKTKSGNALTFSGRLSRLILHGFIVKMEENLDEDIGTGPRKLLTDVCEDLSEMREIVGRKPEFEIGSSVPLPFAGKENYIWRIRNTYQDDLIDEDELLDESDKLKPNVSSLKNMKVCATTERRKACKDCSCGLAEELSNDKSEKETPKSSCGNCYLGDAFRCASCPYMGMPAFKPGEKIVLPDSQLDADL